VTVREARQEDADAIAELLGELGYPADAATVRDRLARMGSADAVLLADGGLVALHRIPLLAEGGGLARITAPVVAERQRRTGLDEALLAAAEDLARRWGCDRLRSRAADDQSATPRTPPTGRPASRTPQGVLSDT